MVTMDPERARAFLRSFKEHERLGDEYSRIADVKGYDALVYYIQFRDVIKIGTTNDLHNRLSCLPWEVLLGVEPGSLEVERHRHKMFRHHRYMDEWFHDVPAIRAHVDRINQVNAEWLTERLPGITVPYEYPSRHKHTYR